MRRRKFLLRATSVGMGLVFSRCQTDVPAIDRYFTSTFASGHDHQVLIDELSWVNPPETGKTFTSTRNLGHVHGVYLTYTQLMELNQGEIILAQSIDGDHTHFFRLCLKET